MFDDLSNKKTSGEDSEPVGGELIKDKLEPIKQPFIQQSEIPRSAVQQNNENKPLLDNNQTGQAPLDKHPTGQAEDIFADTDKGGSALPGKPDVFKPKTDEFAGSGKDKNRAKQASAIDAKKYIIAAVVILGLALVVFGGYLVYNKYIAITAFVIEDIDKNAAEQPENNIIETPIQPKEQIEKQPEFIPEQPIAPPKDSDQDGLTDEEEARLGTNPNSVDSDGDGLFDREEVKIYKTDPKNSDTDGDGYSDGDEVKAGYNPNGAGKLYEVK